MVVPALHSSCLRIFPLYLPAVRRSIDGVVDLRRIPRHRRIIGNIPPLLDERIDLGRCHQQFIAADHLVTRSLISEAAYVRMNQVFGSSPSRMFSLNPNYYYGLSGLERPYLGLKGFC